jgi:hypothetical protein
MATAHPSPSDALTDEVFRTEGPWLRWYCCVHTGLAASTPIVGLVVSVVCLFNPGAKLWFVWLCIAVLAVLGVPLCYLFYFCLRRALLDHRWRIGTDRLQFVEGKSRILLDIPFSNIRDLKFGYRSFTYVIFLFFANPAQVYRQFPRYSVRRFYFIYQRTTRRDWQPFGPFDWFISLFMFEKPAQAIFERLQRAYRQYRIEQVVESGFSKK